jgi:hypothetical protein
MLERGVALADEETMSQAIHDVYCGIAADHDQPNKKDHRQALAMIAALQKYASKPPARVTIRFLGPLDYVCADLRRVTRSGASSSALPRMLTLRRAQGRPAHGGVQ